MGEFIKHNGERVKLGVCDDLYYTTAPQYLKAYREGELDPCNGKEPEYYLKNNRFLFRFPFTDERENIGDYENFDRGLLFRVPAGFAEIAHIDTFCEFTNEAGDFAIKIPCPQSEAGKASTDITPRHNKPKETLCFEVTQQKIKDNNLVTICRCPFCYELSPMSYSEIYLISGFIEKSPKGLYSDLQRDVIKIALAGYLQDFR